MSYNGLQCHDAMMYVRLQVSEVPSLSCAFCGDPGQLVSNRDKMPNLARLKLNVTVTGQPEPGSPMILCELTRDRPAIL